MPAKPVPAKPVAAKPVPAKPVAAKPVPAKPAAAKPVPAKPAAAKPVPAKPVAAKPVAAKPVAAKPVAAKPGSPKAVKPAAGKAATKKAAARKPAKAGPERAASASTTRDSAVKPTVRSTADSAEPAAASAPEIRRPSWGLTADQQIAIRNQSSRADAKNLAAARFAAASRALKSLDLEVDKAPPAPAGLAAGPAATGASDLGATAEAKAGPAPATGVPSDALLEVKPPIQRSDPGHIGERLVIFGDRVELHDRNDRVRQVISGDDIVDVVVHKRFAGATVTVESLDGSSIVAKGLSPDKAEKVRDIIQRRTRQTGPATRDRQRSLQDEPLEAVAPGLPTAMPPQPSIDVEDLMSKLVALKAAGILTDVELAEKRALVARLAAGESLPQATAATTAT